ncbi:RNA polymerase sigma factor [Ferruginibacter sp. HRS2-29]|uniref:RNA polymerase sigma factor n=1 Tax=Ferruginibacter sp. HRS2-29 TaxID=2487334 RepID=UPI0020CE24A7|nr:sigma-70 family RNA polymerase sigma factor [Ferruginibacter sp. HRS2-29]MCP9749485.1 sigma-70 family RNA polymerase sigma factor [Ferruginibacter sp. HRS2-29]
MNIKTLVEEALLFDADAQQKLFDRYHKPMMQLCLKHFKNREDAREVVMGSFQAFFKNLHRFEYAGESSVFKWLAGFGNVYILRQRRQKKMQWRPVEEYDLGVPEDTQSRLEEKMDGAILMKYVMKYQDNVYVMVLILNVMLDWNHSEISERLRVSNNTSRSYLLRGKEFLQKKLNPHKNSFHD